MFLLKERERQKAGQGRMDSKQILKRKVEFRDEDLRDQRRNENRVENIMMEKRHKVDRSGKKRIERGKEK